MQDFLNDGNAVDIENLPLSIFFLVAVNLLLMARRYYSNKQFKNAD